LKKFNEGTNSSSTIDWRVTELQSGAKIWDLQLNPPGTKDVNLNVPVIFMNN